MPAHLTGSNTYHSTITVPEAGDDRTAASIVPAFQALLDCATNAKARADAIDTDDHEWAGEHVFGASAKLGDGIELAYTTPRTRTMMLPLVAVFPPWTGAAPGPWNLDQASQQWIAFVDAAAVNLSFYLGAGQLPTAARIKKVRAAVYASVATELRFHRIDFDTTGANAGVAGVEYTAAIAAGPTAGHVLEVACDEPVDNADTTYRVVIDVADSPGLILRWIQIEYTDPGPRSY